MATKLIPNRSLPGQFGPLKPAIVQKDPAKPDFMKYAIAPFCMTTDSLTLAHTSAVASTSILATAAASTTRLRSTYRAPMIVTEIRFNVRAISNGATYREFRWTIRGRVKVGHYSITNNFVPLWSFGPNIQPFGTTESTGTLPQGTTNETSASELASILGVSAVQSQINMNMTRWRLPRPLYVPANVGINADFIRLGDARTGDAAVDMGVSGFYVDPKMPPPAFCDVPYVTAWAGVRAASGVSQSQRSGELDLFNGLGKPFHVQRVVGRLLDANTRGDTYYMAASSGAQLRMLSKRGGAHKSLVPFFTPYNQVFNPQRLIFNTPGYVLDPMDGVDAEVSGLATNEAPYISLVGWREEVAS